MIRLDVLRTLPDPAILDEPEFDDLRARLDEIDQRADAFAAREAQRYQAHEQALARWHAAGRAAALAGHEPPTDPEPQFVPAPGGDAFPAARRDLARDVATRWQERQHAIVSRNLAAAEVQAAADRDEHADAVARLRAADGRVSTSSARERFWRGLLPPVVRTPQADPGRPATDRAASAAADVVARRDPWEPPPVAIRADHGHGIALPGR